MTKPGREGKSGYSDPKLSWYGMAISKWSHGWLIPIDKQGSTSGYHSGMSLDLIPFVQPNPGKRVSLGPSWTSSSYENLMGPTLREQLLAFCPSQLLGRLGEYASPPRWISGGKSLAMATLCLTPEIYINDDQTCPTLSFFLSLFSNHLVS